jgi:hypothetical protein
MKNQNAPKIENTDATSRLLRRKSAIAAGLAVAVAFSAAGCGGDDKAKSVPAESVPGVEEPVDSDITTTSGIDSDATETLRPGEAEMLEYLPEGVTLWRTTNEYKTETSDSTAYAFTAEFQYTPPDGTPETRNYIIFNTLYSPTLSPAPSLYFEGLFNVLLKDENSPDHINSPIIDEHGAVYEDNAQFDAREKDATQPKAPDYVKVAPK